MTRPADDATTTAVRSLTSRFTRNGQPVIGPRKGSAASLASGNPKTALERIESDEGFFLQVHYANQHTEPHGRSAFVLKGICDPLLDVKDMAALLEARFMSGAQFQLSGTGQRVITQVRCELEQERTAARAQQEEAKKKIEECAQMARDLEAQKKALEDDPRLKEAAKVLRDATQEADNKRANMEAEWHRHRARLAREELPPGFDPLQFPEAEQVAKDVMELWKDTLDDPQHLVGGDFVELEGIITRAMQRLAVRVSDRYQGLVDV